jgi:uncharacterized membrane protein
VNILTKIGAEPVALARLAGAESSARLSSTADRFAGAQHRYLSIDVLRALAILLMVQIHFVEYLSAEQHTPQLLYDICGYLGLLPAPLFTLLAGLSYSLWLGAQKRAGRSEDDIVKYSFRRGMFVFILGFAVNVFIWLPEKTFMWDILTTLGAAALILAAVRNWHPGILLAICVAILIASPPLRDAAQYDNYWVGEDFQYDFTLKDVGLGFLLNGYFPLLPWLIYPLAGFALGQYFYPHDEDEAMSLPLALPLLGAALVALALVAMVLEPHVPAWAANYYVNDFPDDFYPATTVFVVGTLGGIMLGLWVLNVALDINPRVTGTGRVLTFFRRYSYFALTIYVVHLAIHVWPLLIAAAWQQKASIYGYFGVATSTPVALGLAVVFIAAFYPCLVLLERHKRFSLEHMMRWCCG